MKKFILVAFLFISFLSSCSKNDDLNNNGKLSGIYSEVTPLEGRTQLAFIGGGKVIKASEGSNYSEEYYYEIIGNKIKFTSIGMDPVTSEHYFNRVDESSFEVGNLYMSIPENPPVYILFRKIGLTD